MRSTLPLFLDKLQALIEGIDPNIGSVYQVQERWRTDSELEAGAALEVVTPSALDDPTRAGRKATRFWTLSGHSEPRPLTNQSSEYRNQVLVTPFYQWEEGSGQEAALRTACIELLDTLHLRNTENVVLNTGIGYLGFLEDRPRMQSHVLAAELSGSHIKGHTCPLIVTFFEEVAHA